MFDYLAIDFCFYFADAFSQFFLYTSVMCQLALVLKEFKFKLRSQTSKKKSEILSAAVEKIHSQLEHAQSLIQEDL